MIVPRRLQSLLEMIRFSHTIFALPFAMLAAVMAWRLPTPDGGTIDFGWPQALGILLCMVTGRSAAMSFNRLADRYIDAANPRTQARHLPSGQLSVATVRGFLLLNVALFMVGTCLFLPNRLPLLFGLPVLTFLCGYSYTKRFTALAHFWLGAALMLAPICVWIALRGQWLWETPADAWPAVIVGFAVLLWVAGFDIIYACQDEAFDRDARLKSIPVALGVPGALRLAAACHLLMICLLVLLPWLCPQLALGWIYGCGIAAVAVLLAYEHTIVQPDDLQRVNVAFFQVNAIVSIGIFLIVTADLLS